MWQVGSKNIIYRTLSIQPITSNILAIPDVNIKFYINSMYYHCLHWSGYTHTVNSRIYSGISCHQLYMSMDKSPDPVTPIRWVRYQSLHTGTKERWSCPVIICTIIFNSQLEVMSAWEIPSLPTTCILFAYNKKSISPQRSLCWCHLRLDVFWK
mgnify:CR=1 FL=1